MQRGRFADHPRTVVGRWLAATVLGQCEAPDQLVAQMPTGSVAGRRCRCRVSTFNVMGRPDEALSDYNRALSLAPGFCEAIDGQPRGLTSPI